MPPRPSRGLSTPQLSFQQRIQNNLANALGGLGLDERAVNRFAGRATGFLNDLTPVGDAVNAGNAFNSYRQGDYLAAGGNALLAGLGAVPGIGDAAAKAAKKALKLTPGYHAISVGPTEMDVSVSPQGIAELGLIRTEDAARGAGHARAAMKQLIEAADRDGVTLALTPNPMGRGVSKAKLVEFYKGLGFVPNAGKHKDFSTRAAMIRPKR